MVLESEQPFFAPIAAVVTLGLAPGQRGRRAVEVALGVAVGLAIADVIVRIIGVGAAQIGVVGLAVRQHSVGPALDVPGSQW